MIVSAQQLARADLMDPAFVVGIQEGFFETPPNFDRTWDQSGPACAGQQVRYECGRIFGINLRLSGFWANLILAIQVGREPPPWAVDRILEFFEYRDWTDQQAGAAA